LGNTKGEFIMKKVGILIAFFIVISAFTAAHAENKADSFSFTPFMGGYFFEGNQDYKNSAALGLRAGYNFTKYFGTELFFTYVPSEFKETDSTNNVYVAGIEGLYHFMPDGRFVPFLAIGVGAFHYSDDRTRYVPTNLAVDYGAGFKYFVTENIALRADVRHVLPLNDKYNDLLVTMGINLNFGIKTDKDTTEEPPIPMKLIVDSDKDGVADDLDMCPDTPAGMKVDNKGCSPDLDSDRDGVPDNIDRCPGNPASVVVNKYGCPPDSDNDGVPDYLDNCQGTPAGAKVDKYGCPDDSDNDGVSDYRDKCPNTPSGVAVDKNGCPLAEKNRTAILLKVQFDANKAVINKKYYKEIKEIAAFMKEHPKATATIVGHTDDVEKSGKPKGSMMLSKARANSVSQYLIKKFGIKGSRITTLGQGPDKPIASNKTKEGRQKNRRAVALFESVETK
jgi:OOP family OmpA-OmpF porin